MKKMKRPNIYIGLVGASGTAIDEVKKELFGDLSTAGYEAIHIKISALIAEVRGINTSFLEEQDRIRALMDGGDELRRQADRGDAVIYLAVASIRKLKLDRVNTKENPSSEAERPSTSVEIDANTNSIAFIVDSLKNPEEIHTLRKLYGGNFFCIVDIFSEEKKGI